MLIVAFVCFAAVLIGCIIAPSSTKTAEAASPAPADAALVSP
jgi:hypothetical protein